MYRSRFIWKLYAGYVFLILFTALVVGFFVTRIIVGQSLEETERNLRAKASFLRQISRNSFAGEGLAGLQDRVRELGSETGTRLTVIREDGTVLADSEADPARMNDHGTRPEVLEARRTGEGRSTRYSDTIRMNMMYLALPVTGGDGLAGFVRASLPLTDVSKRLAEVRNAVILTVVLASAAALLLGLLFARRVTEPLTSMTRAAMAIAEGESRHEFEVRSNDEIGTLGRAFNVMIDQLRQRMETIALDRNKVLAILSSMVEGVVAIDREEKVLHLNSAAARILDVERESSIGRAVGDVTTIRQVREILARTMGEVREVTLETKLYLPTGKRKIEMKAAPLRDRDDELAGAVLVLHDVTELRRLEAVRRDFIANISHELKTPVTAIRGLVETLIDDEGMHPKTQIDFLTRIKDQSLRLSRLITDLLTVSRAESREWAPERERVDLRETARKSMKGLRPVGEGKGIVMEIDFPGEPVVAFGDAEGLRQVIENLVDNAVKYTPSGGRVRLGLRAEERFGVVEVEDTGIGIDPKLHSRIFERFYRVDKARSRELGGTGLGLAIVKHLVLAHGGTIEVESLPGRGSTFRVRIPSEPDGGWGPSAPRPLDEAPAD